jgi:hypothetical protein
MNATVSTLDGAERARLQRLLENGVSFPPIPVAPGMHYLDQNGNVMVAREHMTATMSVGAAPAANGAFTNDDGQPCAEFCASSQQDDPTGWALLINIEHRWMYTPENGDAFTTFDANNRDIAPVQVTRANSEWALTSDILPGNSCMYLSQFEHFKSIATENGLFFDATFADPTAATGCVTEYSHAGSDDQRKAQILYRLGVTLAVNADAQRLFPDLPVANAAERAIAQSIRAGTVQ